MAKDIKFIEYWKKLSKDDKEYIRVTISAEAAEYINRKAFEDFGMHNRGVGMEISKIILKAKKNEEKELKS